MSSAAKFNALLASATVFIMYFVVAHLAPRLRAEGVNYPVLEAILALTTSVGVYRLLAIAIRWLMCNPLVFQDQLEVEG
jgi:hypothetical protein